MTLVNAETGELVHVPAPSLAQFEPKTATAEQLGSFAVAVRDWIPTLDEEQLDNLDSVLVAVAKRLRLLKAEASQAEASRVVTLRQIGELLGDPRESQGTRTDLSSNEDKLTKAQKNRRHAARLFAEFSDFVDKEIAEQLAKDKPAVSISRLVKLCQRKRSARSLPMTDRRYSVLYVDPPWQYEGAESGTRQIENQYGTMPLDEIKALEPPAADDAVMFFWVTSPKLADGLAVLKAWGFEYRTCMVWVKDRIGMGYYARQQHELLLIAKRGSLPVPSPEHRPSSVFEGDRTEHSSKPHVVYDLIEAMYPEYERGDKVTDFCEMFARVSRPGWDRWGLDTSL